MREVLREYFQSNEPLAVAIRNWKAKNKTAKAEVEHKSPCLFSEVYPHTEPCVDLKLITCSPGRMPLGEFLDGFLTRDDAYHFSFVQNDPAKHRCATRKRNPHVYRGRYINVKRKEDGTMYPTFNLPRYTKSFSFQDFCRKAAEELLVVGGLVEE